MTAILQTFISWRSAADTQSVTIQELERKERQSWMLSAECELALLSVVWIVGLVAVLKVIYWPVFFTPAAGRCCWVKVGLWLPGQTGTRSSRVLRPVCSVLWGSICGYRLAEQVWQHAGDFIEECRNQHHQHNRLFLSRLMFSLWSNLARFVHLGLLSCFTDVVGEIHCSIWELFASCSCFFRCCCAGNKRKLL